jgi:hypothetical protein
MAHSTPVMQSSLPKTGDYFGPSNQSWVLSWGDNHSGKLGTGTKYHVLNCTVNDVSPQFFQKNYIF